MKERADCAGNDHPGSSLRFGPFELDLCGGELRKGGHRVRLQEQPFRILRMLLDSPGEVVSREDIRKRLWPDNTVVEFDHSISAAVKRLRDALRDSADKPRYIETVARRGYRFIGDIEPATHHPTLVEPTGVTAPATEPADEQEAEATLPRAEAVPRRRLFNRRPWITVGFLAAIVLMVWAGVEFNRRRGRASDAPLHPLMRLDLALGNMVAPDSDHGANAILSPDGTRLVYVSQSKLFIRPLDQTKATELSGTDNAQAPFFSPDGRRLAFFAGDKLRTVSVGGGQVADLCDAPLGAAGGGSWGEDGYIVAAIN